MIRKEFAKMGKRPNRLSRPLRFVLGMLVFVIGGRILMAALPIQHSGFVDFYLHSSRYTQLIERIKQKNPSLDQFRGFAMNLDGRTVDGKHYSEGTWIIMFETEDNGHFGRGGYIYAECNPARG